MALATIVVAALSAAPVAAKRGHFVMHASRTMEAHARGSNGFGFSLSGSGGYVSLTASGHHASVQYLARGHASGRLIKARFGRLGSVSLLFHPHGAPRSIHQPPANCKGRGKIVERGVFVGSLKFEGEMHYSSVRVSHLKGAITRQLKAVCDETREESGGPAPAGWTELQAISKGSRTIFDAFKLEADSSPVSKRAVFIASIFEAPTPKLAIFRIADADAPESSFEVTREAGHVTSATVEPPAPFSGTATYLRSPPSPSESWSGTLAVEFLGLGKVDLTGPGFCAESELPRACAGDSGTSVAIGAGS